MTDTDTATTAVTPLRSGELTYWMKAHSAPWNGGAVSWYPVKPETGEPENWWIGDRDDYWARTVETARTAYGDPNIRYNTDDVYQDRFLVFGDGTPLPKDGTVIYHNTGIKQNFVRNTDGSFTRQDFNGKPIGAPMAPVGYSPVGGQYAPVDAHGNQIAPLVAELPGGADKYRGDSLNGIWTPRSDNGDYYTVRPSDGSVSYFDRDGKPIDEQRYRAEAPPAGPGDAQASSCGGCQSGGGPHGSDPAGGEGAELESTPVVTPEGMRPIDYPLWAKEVDPDIPNQMTAVVARLYELFGSGSPTQSELPDFPFNTADGGKSGIDAYDSVKAKFIDIEQRFQAAAQAYRDAVANSAFTTTAGRQAINTAIDRFNTSWQTLPEADWAGLLTLESQMLDNIKGEVMKAAGRVEPIPANPDPAPFPGPDPGANPDPGIPRGGEPEPAPEPPTGPAADAVEDDGRSNPVGRAELQEMLDQMNPAAPPAAPAANPLGALGGMNPLGAMGGMNPLGGLGGMNPLGQLGGLGGLGGPASPVSPLPDAGAGPVRPLEPIPPAAENQRVTPVDPVTPAPAGPASPGPLAAEAPEPPFVPGGPVIEPAGLGGESVDNKPAEPAASGKPTVTLPDGKVIEASDPQAAKAAQAALDGAGPGGDAAQKAYSQAGLELPSDGKNPGAKVDPADMQPGDILKWQDKTMVAVAPGLVADPTQPGVTRTLQEVLANPQGFQGMFRPTDVDPTLSAPDSSPPRNTPPVPPPSAGPPDSAPPSAPAPPSTPAPPSPAPGETIPLAGTAAPAAPPAPGQSAPPSPFENQSPPPPVRTTKADRIASGEE